MLTTRDVAKMFGYNPSTVAQWRAYGTGPRFTRLPTGRILYDERDVDEWAGSGKAGAALRNSMFPHIADQVSSMVSGLAETTFQHVCSGLGLNPTSPHVKCGIAAALRADGFVQVRTSTARTWVRSSCRST